MQTEEDWEKDAKLLHQYQGSMVQYGDLGTHGRIHKGRGALERKNRQKKHDLWCDCVPVYTKFCVYL